MQNFYTITLALSLLISSAICQQLMNEMEIEDISSSSEIKSVIVRDKTNALLIVKSQITSLEFESNNLINNIDQVEPGKWYIYLKPGTHRISFKAEGFISVRLRFFFNAGDVHGVLIRAIPAEELHTIMETGIIYINTQPQGINIFLDNKLEGESPLTLLDVPAGEHIIKVKWNDNEVSEEKINLDPDEVKRLNYDVDQRVYILSKITILSNPPDAEIFLDGKFKGRTPLLIDNIKPGDYYIVAKSKDYFQVEKLEIKSQEKKTMNFDLVNNNLNIQNILRNILANATSSNIYLNNMLIKNIDNPQDIEIKNIFNRTRFGFGLNKSINISIVNNDKLAVLPIMEIKKGLINEQVRINKLNITISPLRSSNQVYFNGIFVDEGLSHIFDVSEFEKNDQLYIFDYNEVLCRDNNNAFFVNREFHPKDSVSFDTNMLDDLVLISPEFRIDNSTNFNTTKLSEINFSIAPENYTLLINNFSKVKDINKLYVPPGEYQLTFISNNPSTMNKKYKIKYEVEEGKDYDIQFQFK